MDDWNLQHELFKGLISSGGAVIVVSLGWIVGNRMSDNWNQKQKSREIRLVACKDFYAAYGEFFAVWKLWNRLEHNVESFEGRRWEMIKRAADAEASIESIVVKLSAELILKDSQIQTLGCFRQAFQQLRQTIRDRNPLPWQSSHDPRYLTFKTNAVSIAALLASEWPKGVPGDEKASVQLTEITSNKWEGVWARSHGRPTN